MSEHEPRLPVRPPTDAEKRYLDSLAEIREVGASEAGRVAYLSRILVQVNLPYRALDEPVFERRNGSLVLTLQAPPHIGLPSGRYPRLLLPWIGAEAVRTRSRRLDLGPSLSSFLSTLGIGTSGGRTGPFGRFKDQLRRLAATSIFCSWDGELLHGEAGYRLASSSTVWWEAEEGGQLTLSTEFFEELLAHPVPVDYRVLQLLRSPLAIDIYAWVTWRTACLDRPLVVPWSQLAEQFGSSAARQRKFREMFERSLRQVLAVYPEARVGIEADGIEVRPGCPHVKRVALPGPVAERGKR